MEERVNRLNSWASLINGYGKILGLVLFFVVTASITYYQIHDNSEINIKQDEKFEQLIEHQAKQLEQVINTMNKEFQTQAQRSDKRYSRAMDEAEELHHHDDKHDERIMELTKEIWYIKGKLDN